MTIKKNTDNLNFNPSSVEEILGSIRILEAMASDSGDKTAIGKILFVFFRNDLRWPEFLDRLNGVSEKLKSKGIDLSYY